MVVVDNFSEEKERPETSTSVTFQSSTDVGGGDDSGRISLDGPHWCSIFIVYMESKATSGNEMCEQENNIMAVTVMVAVRRAVSFSKSYRVLPVPFTCQGKPTPILLGRI